jgi:hypothetical protein
MEKHAATEHTVQVMDGSLVDFRFSSKFVDSQAHLLRIASLNLKSGI